MNRTRIVTAIVLLAVGAGAGFIIARSISPQTSAEGDREILYWAGPMDPSFRSDKPGKSPMGMELVPVYKDEAGGASGGEPALQLNPAVINNIGVRTARVQRGVLHRITDAVGFVEPNDDLVSVLHVRSEGWIEHLFFKTEGEFVNKGDVLFQFYSPVIANAKTEYVQALRIGRSSHIAAANERLLSLGMDQDQIDALQKTGKSKRLVDVRALQDGVILDLNVREGAYIQPGMTVLRLADLNSIWVQVEVFEDQANWVEDGQRVIMHLPFIPGRIWEGVVDYVYPTVDEKSRTVRVRLKFDNTDQVLKPGMYAEISIYGKELKDALSIPREALIRAGKSERAILSLGQGRFRPAQIVSGMEVGDRVEILSGLNEGEEIVISSQFLIDSEASLVGSLLRMDGREGSAPTAGAANASLTEMSSKARPAEIQGQGIVNTTMPNMSMINITHEPVEALNWPVMTMDFTTSKSIDLSKFEKGAAIRFTLMPDDSGSYMITAISLRDAEGGQ
ncbi:MAG: efflux RND transporter periplasmic adaptor subunit [Alphaproteobacteria bacterium]|nr:efflux RND transporter periplasmic adaptor subunit [Alphaproteobacteria bacterium]